MEDQQAWQKNTARRYKTQRKRREKQPSSAKTGATHLDIQDDSDTDFVPFANDDDDNVLDVNDEQDEQKTADGEQETVQEEVKTGDEDNNLHAPEPDWNNDRQININVNTEMRDNFRKYCAHSKQNLLEELTDHQVRGIRLMDILRRKRAPMDTYNDLMKWHFTQTGELHEDDKLGDVDTHISRNTLVKHLKIRYNLVDKFPTTKTLVLPYSRWKVDLVCHDAWGCLESLLTDPRVMDDDFWFFNHDPRAPPPEDQPYIRDLYSGQAYTEAVKAYKTAPDKIPLPLVMYLDGADTGEMKNMPINALKFTLGIFTRKYRENPHAWRVLGHVANIKKAKS